MKPDPQTTTEELLEHLGDIADIKIADAISNRLIAAEKMAEALSKIDSGASGTRWARIAEPALIKWLEATK